MNTTRSKIEGMPEKTKIKTIRLTKKNKTGPH
jgi:hypothetical protein